MSFAPEKLLQQLLRYPLPAGYLVGFSGGMDSHVLLDALVAIQSHLSVPIRAIHTDHGLQPESSDWTLHCASLCEAYQIPFVHRKLNLKPDKGESLEAAAREARYQAISGVLLPGEVLLTAHHQDDQAETLFLQLLRGAGLSGLSAMPVQNDFACGQHARPLLDFSRAELEHYAREQGLEWIEDESNQDISFDRNYLRHEVIPRLTRRWPSMAKTVSRSARHCADADQLLDETFNQQLDSLLNPEDGTLSVDLLKSLPSHHVSPLLRCWIKGAKFNVPDTVTLARIIQEVIQAGADRNPLVSWAGAEVRRYRDRLYLIPPPPAFDATVTVVWKGESVVELPSGLGTVEIVAKKNGKVVSLPKSGQYCIRFRQGGECCRPAGRGVNKRVKHLLQEYAVLPWMRERIPLLEIEGEIAAIPGVCLCEPLGRFFPEHQVVIDWHSPLIWHQ